MPKITKTLFAGSFLFTLAAHFGLLSPWSLILDWQMIWYVIKWRAFEHHTAVSVMISSIQPTTALAHCLQCLFFTIPFDYAALHHAPWCAHATVTSITLYLTFPRSPSYIFFFFSHHLRFDLRSPQRLLCTNTCCSIKAQVSHLAFGHLVFLLRQSGLSFLDQPVLPVLVLVANGD